MVGKRSGLIAFASGVFLSMVSLVSAQLGFFDTRYISESVVNFYVNFFGPIFAALFGRYNSNEFLFAKVLMFFLLIFVINFVLKKSSIFGKSKGVAVIVSIIISLLAIRFIPDSDFINGILLPYGVLGVSLITFLPFLIYFFFVYKSDFGKFGRVAAWGVYGLVYLVLLASRWSELSTTSSWIALSGLILVILIFFFDSTIHRYFYMSELEKSMSGSTRDAIIIRINKREAAMAAGDLKRAKELEEEILELGGRID